MARTREVGFPLILVNFKTYKEAMGKAAVSLAKAAQDIAERTGVCIAVAPQAVYVGTVVEASDIPVFAQHVDPVGHGQFTGHMLPEAFAEAGCAGTLINHSEHRLEMKNIEPTIRRAKETKLLPVVCVDTVERGRAIAPLKPDVIAIEPPELIGSGVPVSKAKPEVVSGAVEAVKSLEPWIRVLCGAGITSGSDALSALRLGAEGVLVASGIVKAKNPREALKDLADAISSAP